MKINFKKIVNVFLVVGILGSFFHTFAMSSDMNPEERIDSIIRSTTKREDEAKIRDTLNREIRRGTGIIGGGYWRFKPYEFHKDEPRKVHVYTIPLMVNTRSPIIYELVDMLWITKDATVDLTKVNRSFINQTQRLLDDFRSTTGVSASYVDVLGSIEEYLAQETKYKRANPEIDRKVRKSIKDVCKEVEKKWTEYKKPDVSPNATAMNILLKLYNSIGNKLYKTSTNPPIYHDVFVLAYDDGADNRWFLKRWLNPRDQMGTCVAFTTIGGLDKSATYYTFDDQFERLQNRIARILDEFFEYINGTGKKTILEEAKAEIKAEVQAEMKAMVKPLEERQDVLEKQQAEILKKLDEYRAKLEAERNEFGKISQSFKDVRNYVDKITSYGGKYEPEDEECHRALDNIDKCDRYLAEVAESNDNDEIKKLRHHLTGIKKAVAQHAKTINGFVKFRDDASALIEENRKVLATHKETINTLMADRDNILRCLDIVIETETRVNEISQTINDYDSRIKRDEERLEVVAEGAFKKLILEQYQKSNWFARMRMRTLFSFLKEVKI